MQEPLVGSLIADRYRVVRRLGAGGMGTVYVALQQPIDREVALKVVRRDLAGDEVAVERFEREARALARAAHPHVVTLLDFGQLPGGLLYFAMELVKGENLRQRLRRGVLAPKQTLGIVKQCCGALAAAHQLGIIHRDLKPENILLMEAAGTQDFVKIVDFGVAKVVQTEAHDADPDVQLTDRNSVVGTPGYIAPEVSLHGVTTDPRSDLYALGVVWFEMLTGRAPFRATTPTALLMAHALDPVPPLPPEIPLPIAGLVLRLLAKDPKDRPASAEELVAIIDALPPIGAQPYAPLSAPAFLAANPVSPNDPTAGNTPRPMLFTPSSPRALPNPAVAPVVPVGVAAEAHAAITESGPMRPARGASARMRTSALVAFGVLFALAGAGFLAWRALRDDDAPRAGADAGAPTASAPDAGRAPVVVVPDAHDAGVLEPRDAGAVDEPRDGGSVRDAGPKRVKHATPPVLPPHTPDLGGE